MPTTIDRTKFNLLVDDDGSGNNGSVWDKTDVAEVILDPVDAIFANTSGVSIAGPVIFPATQVPSADPNALDDYEEGSWTPELRFGGANTSIAYSTRTGTYTKIGNLVYVEFRIALSSKGTATGSATITGMPFAASGAPVGSPLDFAVAGASVGEPPFFVASLSTLHLVFHNTAASVRAALSDTHIANNSDFRGSMTFRV